LLKFFWLKGDGRKKKTAAIRCLSDKGILDRPARREAASDSYFELRSKYGPADELPYAKLCQLGMALQLEKQCPLPIVELLGPKRKNGMRTLTAYWIGVVIVLAVLNGIRALPAGSRARRSMWNMGIAAAVLGGLAIIALKSVSQNANSPSTADAQQINTSIVVPGDIMQVQSRLIDLGYMIGPPDGLWGKKSRQALRAFKAANGIQADDRWGSEISAKLFSTQARKAAPSLATVNTVR
jgi:hypothetical protein